MECPLVNPKPKKITKTYPKKIPHILGIENFLYFSKETPIKLFIFQEEKPFFVFAGTSKALKPKNFDISSKKFMNESF